MQCSGMHWRRVSGVERSGHVADRARAAVVVSAHLWQLSIRAARRAQHSADRHCAAQQTAAHHLILRALHSLIK